MNRNKWTPYEKRSNSQRGSLNSNEQSFQEEQKFIGVDHVEDDMD